LVAAPFRACILQHHEKVHDSVNTICTQQHACHSSISVTPNHLAFSQLPAPRLFSPAMASALNQQSVYPKSYVGFDSITNQIEKKLVKRGFQFNIICVGKLHSSLCSHNLVLQCSS
jgi:hypothetical protein